MVSLVRLARHSPSVTLYVDDISRIYRTEQRLNTVFKTARTVYSVAPASGTASSLPQQTDLLERYRSLVTLGRIRYDEQRIRTVMQLRRLQCQLNGYAPPAFAFALSAQRPGPGKADADDVTPWWSSSHPEERTPSELVHIRSLCEELDNLDAPKVRIVEILVFVVGPYKSRKHYHQLVLELYRAVWEETQRRMGRVRATENSSPASAPVRRWDSAFREQWRQLAMRDLLPLQWRRNPRDRFTTHTSNDGFPMIAFVITQRLVLRHWLLVFNEVQLLDVSSAGLMSDVLSWYWRMGGVIVGTSNKVPDDLYKNGVQQERLEPFVEALKARCPVVSLSASQDWRWARGTKLEGRTWFTWGQEGAFEESLQLFPREAVTEPTGHGPAETRSGDVMGIPYMYLVDDCRLHGPGTASANSALRNRITRHVTIAIADIPVLRPSAKNQARRFISLIDALYEARCRLVCHAETNPENLFFPDAARTTESAQAVDQDLMHIETVAEMQDVYRPNVSMYNAPSVNEARVQSAFPRLDKLDIFSGQEEQFAFKRALSRMTSLSYRLEEQWNPLPLAARKWERRAGCAVPTETEIHVGSLSIAGAVGSENFAESGSDVLSIRPEAPR